MRVNEQPGFVSLMPTGKQMNRLLRDLSNDSERVRIDIEHRAEEQKHKREEALLRAEEQFDADAYGSEWLNMNPGATIAVPTEAEVF